MWFPKNPLFFGAFGFFAPGAATGSGGGRSDRSTSQATSLGRDMGV